MHGIVPGGGLSPDQSRWIACRPGFFLPVRVLSRLFRRRFLEELEVTYRRGQLRFFGEYAGLNDVAAFARWLAPMYASEWVVYAKRPFAGPKAVLAYLSRYTHRVAISNQRLVALDEHGVTFRWKDYRVNGRTRNKTMTLETDEFTRRFLCMCCLAVSTASAITACSRTHRGARISRRYASCWAQRLPLSAAVPTTSLQSKRRRPSFAGTVVRR